MFSVGGVLNRTFVVYFQNFPAVMGISILAYAPMIVVNLSMLGSVKASPGMGFVYAVVLLVVSLFSNFIMQGAITYGVYQSLNQRAFPFGDSLGVALRSIGVIFIISLIVGFLSWVGLLLLVVPGLIIWAALWVAVPAVVVERKGVEAALDRSRQLTVGYRMRIFGLLVILSVIGGLVSLVVSAIGMVFPGQVAVILNFLPSLVWGALSSVSTAVGYYYLRMDVEGLELGELASVFD